MTKKVPGEVADPVNPPHYKTGSIECIEAIKAMMTPDEFRAFLRAQVVKYLWRGPHKGCQHTDYEKALWYLTRLISETEEQQ